MSYGCSSFGVRPGTGMPSVLAGCPEIAAVTSVPAAAPAAGHLPQAGPVTDPQAGRRPVVPGPRLMTG